FTRAGLNVDITTFPSAPAMIAAVIGNAIDVGTADVIQLGNAYNHGVGLAFFAGAGLYTSTAPATFLCVAKDSPVRTAKDLEGKTVAVVALTSISTMTVREWIRENGADPALVTFFEIPFSSMVPALTRGTTAAALIGEPFISVSKGDVRLLADAQHVIAKSFYISALFASRDWLARNTDAARRLRDSLYQTARWANAHQADTAAILSKYTKLDVDRIRAMTRARFATSLDPRLMQPVLDFAFKNGALDKPVNAAALIAPIAP
ncbi:MAG TPA: ABC transporter substrate-binding protein, partial [Candidatus Binatia bacterium]|nr:ABC transporter substrate-binding protein [Candidatus Binatia bacterium]